MITYLSLAMSYIYILVKIIVLVIILLGMICYNSYDGCEICEVITKGRIGLLKKPLLFLTYGKNCIG